MENLPTEFFLFYLGDLHRLHSQLANVQSFRCLKKNNFHIINVIQLLKKIYIKYSNTYRCELPYTNLIDRNSPRD